MPFNPIDIRYHPKSSSRDERENRGSYESSLDLNEYAISHPASTFFIKVEGNAMEGAGIFTGDLLIVDRAAEPASGRIVVMVMNGEFSVRRLLIKQRRVFLASDTSGTIEITPDTDASLWGVVVGIIRKY